MTEEEALALPKGAFVELVETGWPTTLPNGIVGTLDRAKVNDNGTVMLYVRWPHSGTIGGGYYPQRFRRLD